MQLIGANATTFELSILGYEFPNNSHHPYDADWLMVRFEVTDHRGRWTSTKPCLLTWEVAELANWLDTLALMFEGNKRLGFMEPNLVFKTTIDPSVLRVYFDQESRPPWDPSRFGLGDGGDAWIELTTPIEGLAMAAAALRDDLRRFPIRVGKPTRHTSDF